MAKERGERKTGGRGAIRERRSTVCEKGYARGGSEKSDSEGENSARGVKRCKCGVRFQNRERNRISDKIRK
jgi:hypothetical protein